MYIDRPDDGITSVFGKWRDKLPERKYVFQSSFQTNPWGMGAVSYPLQPFITELILQFFGLSSSQELSRNFIVHGVPRFIRITGVAPKEQMGGKTLIDDEMMSVILRRFSQLDRDSCYLSWRHLIEPEFLIKTTSKQYPFRKQLAAGSVKYDLTSVQMFFTIVPRRQGWMIIFWGYVMSRVLTVVDPNQQARMNGPSSSRHFVTRHSVVNKAELLSCTSADTLMASSSCVRLRSKMFLKLSVKPSTNASRSWGTTLHLP